MNTFSNIEKELVQKSIFDFLDPAKPKRLIEVVTKVPDSENMLHTFKIKFIKNESVGNVNHTTILIAAN